MSVSEVDFVSYLPFPKKRNSQGKALEADMKAIYKKGTNSVTKALKIDPLWYLQVQTYCKLLPTSLVIRWACPIRTTMQL